MPATVTVVCLLLATGNGTACLHITVESLDHAVVVQFASATEAVGVGSMEAKLRPLMVAVAPPVVGALPLPTRVCDRVGAANGAFVTLAIGRIYNTQVSQETTVKGEERQGCAGDACNRHACLPVARNR